MNISGYAMIQWSTFGVQLFCTDENMITWILDELKKFIPSYKLANQTKLISGEIYGVRIEKLQSNDDVVAYWILKQLVLRGWEPFEVVNEETYHLRLVGKHDK